MSVMIVTSLGDLVVDLFTERCPLTCKNFLKLCKIKYYNGCLFHTVQKDFTAQTGDPTGTGTGGDSIYKFLYGDQARFFGDEIQLDLKHSKSGTVAMASAGENLNASQFYITLRDDLDYLDGKHTVFGEVAEGLETLARINEAYVDQNSRPFKNIRIKHTYVLDDPFDDPPLLAELIPDASPEGKPKDEVDDGVRLEDDWVPMDEQLGMEEYEEVLRAKEAHSRAVVLESIGDIPDADVKPPDNVLFVCKLNPVTEDEDLHTIFSRFGTVTSAETIRDFKTGDSLCYAFIEFEDKDACEQAYFKMDNALIDDRRIHVDFSQSVAKLWSQYRRKDQKGKGGGCFKCGSIDHIARDCTGDSINTHNRQKFILKDGNPQHGGGDNSQYEMVFDDDAIESPQRSKGHRSHETEKVNEKRSNRRADSDDHQERDKNRENSRDFHRRKERNKEYQEDDRHRRGHSPYSERERDYKAKDWRKTYNESHRDRRDEARYGKDRRDEARYEKRHGDDDMNRVDRKKDERDSRKRNFDDESGQHYTGDPERRSNRRDTREDSSYGRKSRDDGDSFPGRKEEPNSGKRSSKYDDTHERDRDRDRDRDRGRRH